MEQQQTFADAEYSGRKRTTKREKFLEKIEQIIPWAASSGITGQMLEADMSIPLSALWQMYMMM